jgi:hypothetical protein
MSYYMSTSYHGLLSVIKSLLSNNAAIFESCDRLFRPFSILSIQVDSTKPIVDYEKRIAFISLSNERISPVK